MSNIKTPKLGHDEAEYLLDALSGESWQVIEKWVQFYVQRIQDDVLQLRISSEDDQSELVRRKLRSEGAEKLLQALQTSRESLKKRDTRTRSKAKATR